MTYDITGKEDAWLKHRQIYLLPRQVHINSNNKTSSN